MCKSTAWTIGCIAAIAVLTSTARSQYVYWDSGGDLFRASLEGTNPEFILTNASVTAIDPVDRKIYWGRYRSDMDGSNVELFLTAPGGGTPAAIDAYGRYLYYYGNTPLLEIRRIGLDGSNDELIYQLTDQTHQEHYHRDLAYYPASKSIYWILRKRIIQTPSRIERARIDGANGISVEAVADIGGLHRLSFDTVHRQLLWCEEGSNNRPIIKAGIDGLNRQELQPATHPMDLKVDSLSGNVYWQNYSLGQVWRLPIDGGSAQLVIGNLQWPENIEVIGYQDCNGNDLDDWCEIHCGTPGGYCDVPGCGHELDRDRNGRLDVCDDCNDNGLLNACDLDCGLAGGPCDLPGCGLAQDCNLNGLPDDCELYEADCNSNSRPDECDIAIGRSLDSNSNARPDECESMMPTLIADQSGFDKARVISFTVPPLPVPGGKSALRVRLVSLHHVDPPYVGAVTAPFTAFEGQIRWVGAPVQYLEFNAGGPAFLASSLECRPYYRDWSDVSLLHVFGSAIVPNSIYKVELVGISCMGTESNCLSVSPPLTVATSRWCDPAPPFSASTQSLQPDFSDVAALVDKFRNLPGAPIKARSVMAGVDQFGEVDFSPDISFEHISLCVDAFRGKAYPYSIESCP